MAQAGNVAVPGAAREHFVPSSAIPSSSPPASAGAGAVGPEVNRVRKKRKTSSLLKKKVPPLSTKTTMMTMEVVLGLL